jgi:hypothetical protein
MVHKKGGFETRPYKHSAMAHKKGGFETRPYKHSAMAHKKGGFETRPYMVLRYEQWALKMLIAKFKIFAACGGRTPFALYCFAPLRRPAK